KFLENKPNIAGSGHTWLFDIDSLTRTMNYQPVAAGNQTNSSAGFQDKFDAEKAGEKINQQYVLFSVWSSGFTNPQNYDGDAAFDENEHDIDAKKPESEVILSPSSNAQSRKQDDKTKKEAKGKILTVGQNNSNSTNPFSAAGPSNTTASPTHRKSSFIDSSQLSDDPNIPEMEDITYFDDENNDGAEADFNNLETSITNEPNSGDFTMDVVEDIFPTREPRVHVHNVLPNHPTLQLNLDFTLSSESLFAYVVWIFLPFPLIFICSSISSILRE
nr:hypothetical protein [Tanacetum cinerariifolium]